MRDTRTSNARLKLAQVKLEREEYDGISQSHRMHEQVAEAWDLRKG